MTKMLVNALACVVLCSSFACSVDEGKAYLASVMENIFANEQTYIRDLGSGNLVVKKRAIYYLGKKKVKEAVPAIMKLLKKNQPKTIILNSIVALGKIGDPRPAEALIKLLDDDDQEIRVTAIWALGKTKSPKAVRPLLNLVGDKTVCLTVIWALGYIGERDAVPKLTSLLKDDDKFIRYNAAQSLKHIGNLN